MGVMHFTVHSADLLTTDVLDRACFVGADFVPWLTRFRRTPQGFDLERDSSESGNLRMPWPVAGHGELMIATASLMERSAAYQLEVELARGKLNQVRNQLADWQSLGLSTPAAVTERVDDAIRHFARAATVQQHPAQAAEAAEAALAASTDAARALGAAYADQAIAARRRGGGRIDAVLTAGLGNQLPRPAATAQLLSAFSAAAVPMNWMEIESNEDQFDWKLTDQQLDWCQQSGLRVVAGPLVRLDRWGLPDWLCLWSGNATRLTRFAKQYVEQVVLRYRGRVHAWYAATRLNSENGLDLGEEQTLRLAMEVLSHLRQADPNTPILLGIDQPWADHQGHRECDLSPWHFADALARSDLGLTGLVLEWSLGYYPSGSPARDLIDLSKLLDFWSILGLPLQLNLSVPSATGPDPLARSSARPGERCLPGGPSLESQKAWVETYLPLILAKPLVRGVIWNEVFDAGLHDLAHGGLFDAAEAPKPALASLAAVRRIALG